MDCERETYGWVEICGNLRVDDVRRKVLLELFIAKYGVSSSVDALVSIPRFLNEYMVSELDYREFLHMTELAKDLTDEEFYFYQKQNLAEDVGVAVKFMLEVTLAIVKHVGLPMSEVKNAMPDGTAVRRLPKCAAISRLLPGALGTLRSLRQGIPTVSFAGANPFEDEAAQEQFCDAFRVEWDDISAATAADGRIKSACSGQMQVSFVSEADVVGILGLLPRRLEEAPVNGYPKTEFTETGPDVLLEVEPELMKLFEEGMILDGVWYELDNGPWFLGTPPTVHSRAPLLPEDEADEARPDEEPVAEVAGELGEAEPAL